MNTLINVLTMIIVSSLTLITLSYASIVFAVIFLGEPMQ